MPNRLPDSTSRAPIPDRKDSDASTTFIHPHPRHGGRRLQRPTSPNHPVYLDHHLHLVHNTAALDYDGTPHDDDRSRSRGANVSPTTGSDARGDRMPRTDRGSHPRVLGPVRSRGRAVGDRDRLARIELPTRRSQPHGLLLGFRTRFAPSRWVLRGCWVSRLVRRTLRRQGLGSGRCTALCVLGLVTLAALALEVL